MKASESLGAEVYDPNVRSVVLYVSKYECKCLIPILITCIWKFRPTIQPVLYLTLDILQHCQLDDEGQPKCSLRSIFTINHGNLLNSVLPYTFKHFGKLTAFLISVIETEKNSCLFYLY